MIPEMWHNSCAVLQREELADSSWEVEELILNAENSKCYGWTMLHLATTVHPMTLAQGLFQPILPEIWICIDRLMTTVTWLKCDLCDLCFEV